MKLINQAFHVIARNKWVSSVVVTIALLLIEKLSISVTRKCVVAGTLAVLALLLIDAQQKASKGESQ